VWARLAAVIFLIAGIAAPRVAEANLNLALFDYPQIG
jgi:hypothetical protein